MTNSTFFRSYRRLVNMWLIWSFQRPPIVEMGKHLELLFFFLRMDVIEDR